MGTLGGSSVVICGWFAITVSATALDAPDPGLVAVMLIVPALRMSVEGTVAVACVDDTRFVPRVVPLARMTMPAAKFPPLTVSVNDGLPATTVFGSIETITGVAANAAAVSPNERARTAAVRTERMRSD